MKTVFLGSKSSAIEIVKYLNNDKKINYQLNEIANTSNLINNKNIKISVEEKDFVRAKKIIANYMNYSTISKFSLIENFEHLKVIHYLIQHKKTGNISFFAEQVGIKVNRLRNIMRILKMINAPIKFDKDVETFYYKNDFYLHMEFSLLSISEKEVFEIYSTSDEKLTFSNQKKATLI